MMKNLILASGSEIRASLLRNAGLTFEIKPVRVDEETIRQSLLAERAKPRDIADALAQLKAQRQSERDPEAFVLGCDQILEFDGRIFNKPESPKELFEQLKELRGKQHVLHSAAVICQLGRPIWRHVGSVRLRMAQNSDEYLIEYIKRNWETVRHCVGGYQIESEGIRLFERVDGDYFSILGLPMFELLAYLKVRGIIPE